MIELNKYKLVPGSEANAVWGGIKGDITKQTDLVQYVSEHGGSDAVWGSISGNISDQVDLQNTLGSYATQSWVSSQQFATQSWVSSQSYLTSDALTGYATQSWVSSQGYTKAEDLSDLGLIYTDPESGDTEPGWLSLGYVTDESMFSTLGDLGLIYTDPESGDTEPGWLSLGYATQEWVYSENYAIRTDEALEPLYSRTEGYLKNYYYYPEGTADQILADMFDQYGQCYVWNLGGVIYGINFLTPEYDDQNVAHIYIYYFNRSNEAFEHVLNPNTGNYVEIWSTDPMFELAFPLNSVSQNHTLWEDSQGRVYFNNVWQVDLHTGEFIRINPNGNMGGQVLTYNGSRSNIIKYADGSIYMLPSQAGKVYKFNETTQLFENVGTIAKSGLSNWYRLGFYYNGGFYIMNKVSAGKIPTAKRFVVSNDGTIFTWATMRPVPYMIGEDLYIGGENIISIVKNNTRIYLAIPGDGKVYRLDETDPNNKVWVEMTTFTFLGEPFTYNANGAECGDYMIGHGYNDNTGCIPYWNFSPSTLVNAYEWDNSVDTRLTAIETNLGEALTITNNILG